MVGPIKEDTSMTLGERTHGGVWDLGILDYHRAWKWQKQLVEKRQRGEMPDVLLLGEHPSVFTLGRGGSAANLLIPPERRQRLGIELVEVERGGDITYHGPGQLVGYPILSLRERGKDVHLYLRQLEEVLIQTLDAYGIRARRGKMAGVWVGEEKIASIGVAVKRWVSYHGFSLNVETDMHYFSWINPCGMAGQKMTSLAELLAKRGERSPDVTEGHRVSGRNGDWSLTSWVAGGRALGETLVESFSRVFEMEMEWQTDISGEIMRGLSEATL